MQHHQDSHLSNSAEYKSAVHLHVNLDDAASANNDSSSIDFDQSFVEEIYNLRTEDEKIWIEKKKKKVKEEKRKKKKEN